MKSFLRSLLIFSTTSMKTPDNSGFIQSYSIRHSRMFYRLEIALHLLVLISILQIVDWPYAGLFVMLFLLMGWPFFNNHSISRPCLNDCQMQILQNPPAIQWIACDQNNVYPAQEVKILMNRWFILLQLGKRQTKIRRILLADSFQSFELYSSFRHKIIETKLC